jgi:hypothetical protein
MAAPEAAAAAAAVRPLSRSAALAWSAAQRAYADALSAASPPLPAPLAARMAGAVALVRAAARRDEDGDFRSLMLHASLAAGGGGGGSGGGGGGVELRFDGWWSGHAYRAHACWRPLPAPPDGPRASLGWHLLCGTWQEGPPETGVPAVDRHANRPAALQVYDTAGLARAGELAALRAAVLGTNDDAADDRASLDDLTFVTLALTACGALGLHGAPCELGAGHVWEPEAEDVAAAPGAQPTSWVEHAVRCACGAPAPWDARYAPYDGGGAVKEDWGEGVLMAWDRHGGGDPWDRDGDDGDVRAVRTADGAALVRVEQLWDYVDAYGCLPFDDGTHGAAGASARISHRSLPPAATPEASELLLRQLTATMHANECALRVAARARARARAVPAHGGKLPLL